MICSLDGTSPQGVVLGEVEALRTWGSTVRLLTHSQQSSYWAGPKLHVNNNIGEHEHYKAVVSALYNLRRDIFPGHDSISRSPLCTGPGSKTSTLPMGLLYLGTSLTWAEAKKYAAHVRHHGITQFLHIWDRLKDRTGDELLWGDEVRI